MTAERDRSIPDKNLVVTNQADRRITDMIRHANRVSEFWGNKRPDLAILTQASLGLVLGKVIQFGGRVMADGQLGLFMSSGFSIGIVPKTLVHVDHRTDEPSVGAYDMDTPYIGLFCFHGFGDGTYCCKPVFKGEPTCDVEDHQPFVMGAPIPIEWSMHS
jgi:hypothetical protein